MWQHVGFCCVLTAFGLSEAAHAANNLVPNGSFEQGDPGATRLPAGWEIEKGHITCFRLASDRPLDRRHCLELTIADEPATLVRFTSSTRPISARSITTGTTTWAWTATPVRS